MADAHNPLHDVPCGCGVTKGRTPSNWTFTLRGADLVGRCVGCGAERSVACPRCELASWVDQTNEANQLRACCECGYWAGPITHPKNTKRSSRARYVTRQHAGLDGSDLLPDREVRCADCGDVIPPGTGELDHRQPLAHGGPDAVQNTQPLCTTCHARKTASEFPGWTPPHR